jgi:hypothetical protein
MRAASVPSGDIRSIVATTLRAHVRRLGRGSHSRQFKGPIKRNVYSILQLAVALELKYISGLLGREGVYPSADGR